MSITQLTKDIAYHQKQLDEPNDSGGLSAADLKVVFDQAALDIKDYINNTLIPQIIASNIPITAIPGMVSTQMQTALAELKTQLNAVVLGQIPSGTLDESVINSQFMSDLQGSKLYLYRNIGGGL